MSQRTKREEAFHAAMERLCGMYSCELNAATVRAYWEGCHGWSAEKITEVFHRAIEAERFRPTIAVLRAYASGIRERSVPVVEAYRTPDYTPEQAEDIRRMIRDLNRSFEASVFAQPDQSEETKQNE